MLVIIWSMIQIYNKRWVVRWEAQTRTGGPKWDAAFFFIFSVWQLYAAMKGRKNGFSETQKFHEGLASTMNLLHASLVGMEPNSHGRCFDWGVV